MAQWVYPTSGRITSLPGPRASPGGVGSTNHGGWDIGGNGGQNVVSVTDGTVIRSGWAGGYGNLVVIQNSDGTISKYGHLANRDVKVGDSVSAGTDIGNVGNTGASTGPHLHYERRDANGRLVDPTGDDSLNGAFRSKGNTMKGSQKGDGTPAKNDGKNGEGKGDDSKKSDHDKRSKENNPPGKTKHDDIKGKAGSYEKTSNQSIVSRMPTHEPWLGHPKSTEGPRQAVRADGGANNGGSDGGTNSGGGGGGGTNSGGAGGGGTNSGGGGGGSSGGGGPLTTGTGTPLSGKSGERASYAVDRLMNKHGFTQNAAEAAVATTMGEALTLDYTKVSNDVNGPSSGIAQWHDVGWNGGGRYTKYKNWMSQQPGGAANFDNQIDYLAKDLKENYSGVYNKMQSSSAEEGVDVMVRKFENPRNHNGEIQKRLRHLANVRATRNKRPKTADNGMNQNAAKGGPGSAPSPAGGGGSSVKPAGEAKS